MELLHLRTSAKLPKNVPGKVIYEVPHQLQFTKKSPKEVPGKASGCWALLTVLPGRNLHGKSCTCPWSLAKGTGEPKDLFLLQCSSSTLC